MYARPLTHGHELHAVQAGGFVVVESSYAPSLFLPRHGHDEAALCFAVRGSFDESIGSRTFACDTYDVMVRPEAVRHSNRYDARGTRCVLIGVLPEAMQRLRPQTKLFDAAEPLPRGIGRSIAMRIHRELVVPDASSPISIEGLVLELIGESSRPQRGAAPHWLKDARDFIHAHWPERPSLADIARAGGIHPANLVRGFRAHLRCSPGEYMRRLRLEHAKNALASSRRPIAEIALEAGFYDQSHFTNAFRRQTGMTPAEFRAAFPTTRGDS